MAFRQRTALPPLAGPGLAAKDDVPNLAAFLSADHWAALCPGLRVGVLRGAGGEAFQPSASDVEDWKGQLESEGVVQVSERRHGRHACVAAPATLWLVVLSCYEHKTATALPTSHSASHHSEHMDVPDAAGHPGRGGRPFVEPSHPGPPGLVRGRGPAAEQGMASVVPHCVRRGEATRALGGRALPRLRRSLPRSCANQCCTPTQGGARKAMAGTGLGGFARGGLGG